MVRIASDARQPVPPVRLSSANAGRSRYRGKVHRRTLSRFFMRSSFLAHLLIGGAHGARVAPMTTVTPPALIEPERVVVLDYTNHAGKRAMRRVLPVSVWFGVSEYHPAHVGPQWFLRALDIDKADPENPRAALPERDFLFTAIHETMTLQVWEHRAASDERWRMQQQAWQIANR